MYERPETLVAEHRDRLRPIIAEAERLMVIATDLREEAVDEVEAIPDDREGALHEGRLDELAVDLERARETVVERLDVVIGSLAPLTEKGGLDACREMASREDVPHRRIELYFAQMQELSAAIDREDRAVLWAFVGHLEAEIEDIRASVSGLVGLVETGHALLAEGTAE